MILCEPYGGICNRLKCIISTLANFDEIILKWDIPNDISDGGVRCHFNNLFLNKFSDAEVTNHIKSCEFIDNHMNTNNYGSKDKLNKDLQNKYINIIKSLIPLNSISDVITSERNKLPSSFTTVSVRTFTSFQAEYNSWGRYFQLDNLISTINSIDGPILLTCDSNDIVNTLLTEYGNKIYMSNKRTKFGDYGSIEGMQDILVDLYLGGMAHTIYGTHMSSFSEMQWWFGLCEPIYKTMNLHKR